MLRSLLVPLLLLWFLHCTGQGVVRGTISDKSGETLIGALIKLKSDPTVGTVSDIDGKYSLTIKQVGEVTLVVTYSSYQSQEVKVIPKQDEVVIVNVEMIETSKELGGVVVERKAQRSGDVHLERLKINSAASIDFISAEAMLKTGDGDAQAAVKRVTGVSTVGAFVTVRGLADRYVVTTINGSRIPTLDPLTNNLKLDLFPTGLLDNIVITKTATPEMPGDWAGALVSLNTSDYPEKLRVSISTTLGFNPNSSFQDIVSAERSSTDWLGHDDGLRAIPEGVPTEGELFPRFISPDVYQQLVILGLGGTLTAYGIVPSTPGFGGSENLSNSNPLHHLILTDLGLLAPALVNDPTASQIAVDTYNSTYTTAYFSPLLNGKLADMNGRFNNANWRVKQAQGSPNFNQTFSIGNQIELFKKKKPKTLGYLFGFRYFTDTQYDPGSTLERTGADYDETEYANTFDLRGTQQISTSSNGWSALGSLSLKLDRNNSFSLMVMPNALGENNARKQVFLKPSVSGETFGSEDQYYEERKLWTYQFGSKHFIPGLRMKVETDLSYSDGSRNVLDLKTVQYIINADGTLGADGALAPPARIYRFLDETMLDARLGIELPISKDERKSRKLKFGGSYRDNTRRNNQTYFDVLRAPTPEAWETPGQFDMRPDGTFPSLYNPFGTFKDSDIGISRIMAGFVMSDYAVNPRLRVVGGLRAEHTDLLTDIQRYYELGLDPNDPSRGTVGDVAIGGAGSPEQKPAVPGSIDQWDLLPSINFIYKLKDDEITPMNLRLNYFRSLGRPSFRELSVVQLYDYILNSFVFGDPNLKITTVDNFDIRVERFFKNRNNVSLSGFYKQFQNHIELVNSANGGFTWRNADRSRVFGVELEGRIRITKQLEWQGNITLMDSRSKFNYEVFGKEVSLTTPMYGQAPYLVNSMLTYSADSIRFSLSASYNVQGPKLAVTNSEGDPNGVRAFEMPRHVVDITLNKFLAKHWGLKLRVRNALNAPLRRSYEFASGYTVDFDKYTYGSEYQFTVSYTIK